MATYLIDGTNFGLNHKSGKKKHGTSNVFEYKEACKRANEYVKYFAGPGGKNTNITMADIHGKQTTVIAAQVFGKILADKKAGKVNQSVTLLGYSRGSIVATIVAQKLESKGIEVTFLGLFDAVEQVLGFDIEKRIPANVKTFLHLTKSNHEDVVYPTTFFETDEEFAINNDFKINRFGKRPGLKGKTRKPRPKNYETHHGDLGKSYKNGRYINQALAQMIAKARAAGARV